MKKILGIFLLLTSVLLTSCNANLGIGSLSFHYVHIQMYGMEKPVHLKVTKWQSDDGGIELHTEDHGTILLGDGTYMMYDNDKCPICGTVSYK